jgi:hypothetical protein
MGDTDTNTTTINGEDFSYMQERSEQTLSDIQHLQQIEKGLYESLEQNANGNNLTIEEKDQIVKKISEISEMRVNLYASLQEIYSFFQKNVASSRTTLTEQKMAIDIVENELKDAKRKLQLLEDEKYNKLRLVEINTYYGKQYGSHAGLMKSIVIICIPVLILSILKNRGIIPNVLGSIIIAIIIVIGIIYIIRQLIDMSNRDNMNYDEYDWYFNKNNAPSNEPSETTDPWATTSLVCVGSQCCNEFSTYDATQNMCVPIASVANSVPGETTS